MPNGLPRAGHAHRQIEQRHGRGRGRVLIQHRLVAAHAGEVVDIARLGHAHDRMDQKVGLSFPRGAEGQFLMRAVQRIARLEGDDLAPAELADIGAKLIRRVAARLEIIMDRLLDAGDRAAEIDRAGIVVKIVHRRMGEIIRAEDFLRLLRLVRRPFVGDRHDGEDDPLLIAQRDVLIRADAFSEFLGDVERDRHRPERAVGEAHIVDDGVIVSLRQEPFQRVETAVHQELQIADLAGRQIPGRQVASFNLKLRGALGGDIEFGDRRGVRGHGNTGPILSFRPPSGPVIAISAPFAPGQVKFQCIRAGQSATTGQVGRL